MLVVTGPRSPNAGETIPMTFDTALAGSGIVAASISGEVGRRDLRERSAIRRRRSAAAQKALDSANPHVAGFDIPNATVTVTTRSSCARSGPATTSSPTCRRRTPPGIAAEAVGRARRALRSSRPRRERQLAGRQDDAGKIHYGADDNASGTAAVLAAGEVLSNAAARSATCCSSSGRAKSSG